MNFFKPFEYVSPRTLKIIAVGQAVVLLGLWSILPFKEIPTPLEILQQWHVLATQQGLLVELMNSSMTILKAIGLATVISLVITTLNTAAFFTPLVRWATALRFLGFAGITFLFTLWTSSGAELKLVLLTFGMTVFLLTTMVAVADDVRQEEIDYARTLKISGWRASFEILLRGRLDQLLDQVRQNAAIGWTLLSMVEGLVRSEGGIGSLLLTQSKHLNLSSIFAIQLTILVYGIIQDVGLRYMREILCPYIKMERK